MTRAELRCYLVAGKIVGKTDKNRPETSPLSYLFHASAGTRISEDLVAGLAADVGTLHSAEMLQQLNGLVEEGKETISLAPVPAAEHAVPYVPVKDAGEILACREFSGGIFRDWHVASFTSFVKHDSGAAAELPDRDESGGRDTGAGMAAAEVPEGKSIFTFPKGAQAGIFMHGIFEELDFSHALPDKINSLVEKGLERYGYEPEWLPHVSSMVTNVVTTPIASPEGHFTLAGLKRGQWLAELEFFFPLNFVTSDTLRDNLRKWGHDYEAVDIRQVCQSLRFRPVRGMVRGFMDMVFEQGGRYYLIDWKSNHLGYQVEAYGKEGLRNEMARKLYPLQYLLYTVALNKFLSLRVTGYDYKKNFGGVLYMFLRGISPERGEAFGVFRDTPPAGMIQEMTEYLIQAGE
jgi:exodeoxyribonuclease V beta subunit